MSITFFKFHQLFFSAPRQPLRRAGFRLCGCAVLPYSYRCVAHPLRVILGGCGSLGAVGGCSAPCAACRGLWRILSAWVMLCAHVDLSATAPALPRPSHGIPEPHHTPQRHSHHRTTVTAPRTTGSPGHQGIRPHHLTAARITLPHGFGLASMLGSFAVVRMRYKLCLWVAKANCF